MATKKITELPIAYSLSGNVGVLANDNGVVKMAATSAIQSNWDETNPDSPAFIMNKPESLSGASGTMYCISVDEIMNLDGSPLTLEQFCNDYRNGVIRTVQQSSGFQLTFDLANPAWFKSVYNSSTVVGFTLSDGELYLNVDGRGSCSTGIRVE